MLYYVVRANGRRDKIPVVDPSQDFYTYKFQPGHWSFEYDTVYVITVFLMMGTPPIGYQGLVANITI
ncbi:hypothetical protein Ciccas_012427, partial [Cichlidogyrus casuarinus]